MKRNSNFRKIEITLVAFLIFTSPRVSAMERDHNYYKQELQNLEESTKRIHKEVDRILAEFKRNIAEYYRHVKGTKTTPQGTDGKSWQDMKEQDKEDWRKRVCLPGGGHGRGGGKRGGRGGYGGNWKDLTDGERQARWEQRMATRITDEKDKKLWEAMGQEDKKICR
jgi:hypothetical protein